jgi:small subunit ribosomal protein S19
MAVKQFMWQGKNEDEIKQLDLEEFSLLVNSRIRRTLKRGFTPIQKTLLKLIASDDKNIKTHCRDMPVLPQMIGKTIRIHNGKDFHPLIVTAEMLGHYLGEFSQTRKSVSHSAAGVGATRSSKAISAR